MTRPCRPAGPCFVTSGGEGLCEPGNVYEDQNALILHGRGVGSQSKLRHYPTRASLLSLTRASVRASYSGVALH